MIEVNRDLYMDETAGQRSAGYEHCEAAAGRIVEGAIGAALRRLAVADGNT